MKTITAAEYRDKIMGGYTGAKTLKNAPRKGKPRFRVCPAEERTLNGTVYASKCERDYALTLMDRRQRSPILWWARQPVFDLGGVKYTADFILVGPYVDNRANVQVVEVKPRMKPGRFRQEALRRFERNRKQVKAIWGVDVELIEI